LAFQIHQPIEISLRYAEVIKVLVEGHLGLTTSHRRTPRLIGILCYQLSDAYDVLILLLDLSL
jgi:hypothetical protein